MICASKRPTEIYNKLWSIRTWYSTEKHKTPQTWSRTTKSLVLYCIFALRTSKNLQQIQCAIFKITKSCWVVYVLQTQWLDWKYIPKYRLFQTKLWTKQNTWASWAVSPIGKIWTTCEQQRRTCMILWLPFGNWSFLWYGTKNILLLKVQPIEVLMCILNLLGSTTSITCIWRKLVV